MTAVALWLALAGAANSGAPAEVSERSEPAPVHVEYLILDAREGGGAALAESLRSRLPKTKVLDFAHSGFLEGSDSTYAYVELLERPGKRHTVWSITIVLPDGRAFERKVEPEPELAIRSVAAMIANTVVAIEEAQVPADRDNVSIPRPDSETESENVHRSGPAHAGTSGPESETETETDSELPAPRLEIGVTARAGPAFGLAPSEATGLASGGGELRGTVRWKHGGLLSTAVRVHGRLGKDAGLLRTRVALGGGYSVRRGEAELVVGAEATVEPWMVIGDALVEGDQSRARRSPLVGGDAWLSAGYLFPSKHGPITRVGAFAELAGSVLPQGGAARLLRQTPVRTETVFTLGGLELSAGLDVTVWIPVARSRR